MKIPFLSPGGSSASRRAKIAPQFAPIDFDAEADPWPDSEFIVVGKAANDPPKDPFLAAPTIPAGEPLGDLLADTPRQAPPAPPKRAPQAPPVAARKPAPAAVPPAPRAAAAPEGPPPGTLGAILVDAGRITVADARRIVAEQLANDAPFGEIAVRLGLATPADIDFALSRQFSLPRLRDGDGAIDPEVVAAFDPGHELAERLRNLRGQIAMRALHANPPLRSVAILGTDRRVGRSFIAANLAAVFAQLGARTLLIDADLVRPRQHALFRIGNRYGLSSILAERARLDVVCPVRALPGLALLTSGPKPPNPNDLISRPTLRHFLRRCEQDFDVILLDTPVWGDGSNARMIATAAGAAVVVAQSGRTVAAAAGAMTRELTDAGTRVLGVVLNRP